MLNKTIKSLLFDTILIRNSFCKVNIKTIRAMGKKGGKDKKKNIAYDEEENYDNKKKSNQIITEKVAVYQEYPQSIKLKDSQIYFSIRGKPNAKTTQITNVDDDAIGVAINAQPIVGAANEELLSYFKNVFSVKKSEVWLDKGATNKNKIIVLNNVSQGFTGKEIYEILESEIN